MSEGIAALAGEHPITERVIVTCWLGLDRPALVQSRAGRLVFALLVLCADGVAYSYRSGQYDCLGMLIVAGQF